MTSLTTYGSFANISSWCTYSPQDPCNVTHYVNWFTHKVDWL